MTRTLNDVLISITKQQGDLFAKGYSGLDGMLEVIIDRLTWYYIATEFYERANYPLEVYGVRLRNCDVLVRPTTNYEVEVRPTRKNFRKVKAQSLTYTEDL